MYKFSHITVSMQCLVYFIYRRAAELVLSTVKKMAENGDSAVGNEPKGTLLRKYRMFNGWNIYKRNGEEKCCIITI